MGGTYSPPPDRKICGAFDVPLIYFSPAEKLDATRSFFGFLFASRNRGVMLISGKGVHMPRISRMGISRTERVRLLSEITITLGAFERRSFVSSLDRDEVSSLIGRHFFIATLEPHVSTDHLTHFSYQLFSART